MTYAAIAREKAAIVERTGLLGEGAARASRVVARFFIEGFGTAEQRAAWLSHLASVAISEPRVGAHPKLLTTRAEEDAGGYSIFGEKAWVTNGPLAAVFIVLAVTTDRGRPQALQRIPGAARHAGPVDRRGTGISRAGAVAPLRVDTGRLPCAAIGGVGTPRHCVRDDGAAVPRCRGCRRHLRPARRVPLPAVTVRTAGRHQ